MADDDVRVEYLGFPKLPAGSANCFTSFVEPLLVRRIGSSSDQSVSAILLSFLDETRCLKVRLE